MRLHRGIRAFACRSVGRDGAQLSGGAALRKGPGRSHRLGVLAILLGPRLKVFEQLLDRLILVLEPLPPHLGAVDVLAILLGRLARDECGLGAGWRGSSFWLLGGLGGSG